MPMLDETLGCIGNSKVISKLDRSKGFHQVPIGDRNQENMAFLCPYGKSFIM